MDSGNSGSMQSSSGGDEEYDSRPESIPSFLNPPPPTHFGASDSNPEPSLLSHFQNHQSAGFFDISSNYFQALSQSQQPNSNPNFLFNLDTVRSRPQRSDPSSCTELGNLAAGGASPSSTLSMLASQGPGPGLGTGLGSGSGPGPGPGPGPTVIQLRSINNEATTGPPRGPAPQTTTTNNNNNNNNAGGRNSKKRTRASRRAPTTVLTTDTSNFRAMVQEFTGIPAPPFSGSSYSRRFDLFGTAGGGGGGSAMRSGNMDTLGPLYPLRPSPQKVHQQSPFLSSSSSSSPLLNNNSMIEATNVATTSNNNFLSSDHHHQGLPKHHHHHHHHHHQHHVMNMQNPINLLPFQSLPQPNHNPLHTSLNVPGFGTRPPQGSLSMASLDELDMSGGSRGYINTTNNRVVDADHGRHELFRALDGNSPRLTNNSSCKLNYTAASSSEFHLEKGLEMNVSTRGEGTVDSWICPSD